MKKLAYIMLFIIIFCALLTACKSDIITINYFDGEDLLNTIEIKQGANIEAYQPPAKTGYTFEGWFTDKEFKNRLTSTEINENLSLYAKYQIKSYTITFKAEGHSDITRKVDYNSSLTDVPAVPSREGFAGVWDTSQYSNITSDITVNAVYSAISFTVTFKADNSNDIIRSVSYGQTLTDIPAVPAKTGYIGNWDKESFTGIKSNITVNAVYTPMVYTITFKIEGMNDIQRTVTYGHALSDIPAIPARTGKTSHWSVTDFSNITSDIIVNAIYEDIIITVTFLSEYQGQQHTVFRYVTYGSNLSLANRPQPYPFQGVTGIWEIADYNNLTEDMTVNAIYSKIDLNVTFLIDDSSITITMPYDSIPIDYIQNTSYQQLGLGDEQQKTNLINNLLNPVPPPSLDDAESRNVRYGSFHSDIFSEIKQHQIFNLIWDLHVTYYDGGGEFIEGAEYVSGEPFSVVFGSILERPVLKDRYGYKFIGWYSDSQYNNPYTFHYELYNDISVYALWEQVFCQVSFPIIDGLTFISDYSQPLPFGSPLAFSITITNPQISILEVKANGLTIVGDGENNYLIEKVEEDLSIALKTNNIDIYILRFYNYDKTEFIYARSVSEGNKLTLVPTTPAMSSAVGFWTYDEQIFDFETAEIFSDMDFTLYYIYLLYNIEYALPQGIQYIITEYQNTDFEFYSPTEEERMTDMLLEGWYLDEELTIRATKEAVASKGRTITLYPKWTPKKNITGSIPGLWFDGLFILELFNDGTAKIYDGEFFIECSFDVSDGILYIMGEQGTYNGTTISFRNHTLVKTESQKNLVKFSSFGLFLIDGYTIPYEENIFEYFWYTDIDRQYIVDITKPLDPSLFANRKLVLYNNTAKLVRINYFPLEGYTGGISYQNIYVTDSLVLSEGLIKATYQGHIFRGWAIEGSDELLTLYYLYNYYQPELNVYAVYMQSNHSVDQYIEGCYVSNHESKLYIVSFSYNENDMYHQYTITTIDTITNTFSISIPYIYYWNEIDGFSDEQGNAIVIDGDTLSLTYGQLILTLNKNSINPGESAIYKQTTEIDDETIVNLIYFDSANAMIKINKQEYSVYQHNNMFYYFDNINQMTVLRYIDINWLTEAAADVPLQYVAIYKGIFNIEEGYDLYVTLDIFSTSECLLNFYADEDRTELIISFQSRFVLDAQNAYILINTEHYIFEIDEINDQYYLHLYEHLQIEMLKIS